MQTRATWSSNSLVHSPVDRNIQERNYYKKSEVQQELEGSKEHMPLSQVITVPNVACTTDESIVQLHCPCPIHEESRYH